jgi:23S rRNA (uracil1939-C5)-methyltransferase
VPLAAPGETVRARITRQKARVAWGELEEIVSPPSAVRVAPPCPLFGTCGGCQWQHVALDAQRSSKRQIVARALGIPEVDLELRGTTPDDAADGAGYRERARVLVGAGGAIGFRARRSHDVVDVPRCLLLAPALAAALASIRRLAAAGWLQPGSELELQGGRSGVHLRVKTESPPPLLSPRRAERGEGRAGGPHFTPGAAPRGTFTAGPDPAAVPVVAPDAAGWLAALRPDGVVGVVVVTAAGRGSAAGETAVDVAEPGSPPLRIPAGGFSQVGRAANAALVEAALGAVGTAPGTVLELYAGSGNFTRHLCARTGVVFAHDGDRDAVARGRMNAPAARWLDDRSLASAMLEPAPDTVFVDPPRGGLDAVAFAAAVRARAQIVYVSCDPQTLGRDSRRLHDAGFRLTSALALDLMPHTSHIEVVARFARVP